MLLQKAQDVLKWTKTTVKSRWGQTRPQQVQLLEQV
jgi:hypothetical protein